MLTSFTNELAYDTAPYELVATVRTHPSAIGDVITQCGTGHGMGVYVPGRSDHDWETLGNTNAQLIPRCQTAPVAEYIVDKNFVLRLTPARSGQPETTDRFNYTPTGCPW